MTDREQGPFEPVFRHSWMDVVALLLIVAACPIVYAVHRFRRWRNAD